MARKKGTRRSRQERAAANNTGGAAAATTAAGTSVGRAEGAPGVSSAEEPEAKRRRRIGHASGSRAARTDPSSKQIGTATDFEAVLAAPGDTSEKLFELANKPCVRFSLGGGKHHVEVAQDQSAREHSGGVIWETSYFLARYLECHVLPALWEGRPPPAAASKPLRIVEVGSGCGLLGLAMARLGCEVLLTEQPAALANLQTNVATYNASLAAGSSGGQATAAQLSWGDETDIAGIRKRGPFDLVVATDVVFAERLVDPLLETIAALLAAGRTPDQWDNAGSVALGSEPSCWLCVQQRDPDAHARLVAKAPEWFRVRNVPFAGLENFEEAEELECVLLRYRLRRVASASESAIKKQKKSRALAPESCR